jgi:aminoglycoside phosphotransferase (APT) family kinase protein
MTIIQGDAHVWNVFLPKADGDDLRLFDWDSLRVDVATDDLAYMMALHWFPDHRRRYEPHLLDRYHSELVTHGVSGYERYALDDDYRLKKRLDARTVGVVSALPLFQWMDVDQAAKAMRDTMGCGCTPGQSQRGWSGM